MGWPWLLGPHSPGPGGEGCASGKGRALALRQSPMVKASGPFSFILSLARFCASGAHARERAPYCAGRPARSILRLDAGCRLATMVRASFAGPEGGATFLSGVLPGEPCAGPPIEAKGLGCLA